MTSLTDGLLQQLEELPQQPSAICVAFSGGVDSHYLLHGLFKIKQAGLLSIPLRALHINHGLHANSDVWAEHCVAIGEALSIDVTVVAVDVDTKSGNGLESAARKARYQALAKSSANDELIALAHHSDDQMETVLFRLLRGTGVAGAAGMKSISAQYGRFFWRPFLFSHTKQDILDEAHRENLGWIEDPSNHNQDFSRNFLRQTIVPQITSRWPSAVQSVGRFSQYAGEADEMLFELAQADMSSGDSRLKLQRSTLLRLSPARQKNLIRYCLTGLDGVTDQPLASNISQASAKQLQQIVEQFVLGNSPQACVSFGENEVRCYQGSLHFLRSMPSFVSSGEIVWNTRGALMIPAGGELVAEGFSEQLSLVVKHRSGGENFQPAGKSHHKLVRRWLQEWAMPTWLRQRVPLIYLGDELIAIPAWEDELPCYWSADVAESLKSGRIRWIAPS